MGNSCRQGVIRTNAPQPLLVHSLRQRDAMITDTLPEVQPRLLLLLSHRLGIQQRTDALGIRDAWSFRRHCFS